MYIGKPSERKDWKNSRRKCSKITNYKIDRLLEYFVRDLSASEVYKDQASKGGNTLLLSEKTIRNKYREFQYVFVRGAYPYPESYGRALVLLMLGEPPDYIRERIEAQKKQTSGNIARSRIRPNKSSPPHFLDDVYVLFKQERALREYARYNIDELSCMVIFSFAIQKLIKIYGQNGYDNFLKFGIEYLSDANWHAGKVDCGMREEELWEKIEIFSKKTEEEYYVRVMRDMKWIISRHPLGTYINKNGVFKYSGIYRDLENAIKEWFPEGMFV